MLLPYRTWAFAGAAVVLGIVCSACQSKSPAPPPAKKPEPTAAKVVPQEARPEQPVAQRVEPKVQVTARRPKPQPLVPPDAIPKVVLSNALRANCLVGVGDAMPQAELPDVSGKIHALESLYGEKLTVVCFWTIGASRPSQLVASATLHDLGKEIAEPFGRQGVRVVAVNVGDSAPDVQRMLAQTGAALPVLLDPKGQCFGQVARDKKMPRIFLLDAAGRILWFDVEYRRQSREDLAQAIRVVLGKL